MLAVLAIMWAVIMMDRMCGDIWNHSGDIKVRA